MLLLMSLFTFALAFNFLKFFKLLSDIFMCFVMVTSTVHVHVYFDLNSAVLKKK